MQLDLQEAPLRQRLGTVTPTDWSGDGRTLYTISQGTDGSTDVWVLRTNGRKASPYRQTPAFENDAKFSPDGKWVAYEADDTASPRFSCSRFPQMGRKYQISTRGGMKPVWRRDGKELFFLSADSRLMAAAMETTGAFHVAPPPPLFAVPTMISMGSTGRQYAVSRDGSRFLVNVREQQNSIST